MSEVIKNQDEFNARYKNIEKANLNSFYFTDIKRPFEAFLSIHSIGQDRALYGAEAARHILAGNMGTGKANGPSEINGIPTTVEDRAKDAEQNRNRFLEALGVEPSTVRILTPILDYKTPMVAYNLDKQGIEPSGMPVSATERSDFIFTYDSSITLAVQPADCPILGATAETPQGSMHFLIHFPWRGIVADYMEQVDAEFTRLEIDRSTLKGYLSPGAQAESFPYKGYSQDPRQQYPKTASLFDDVKKDSPDTWSFNVDTPYFVYNNLLTMGIKPEQLFCDTSDTASLDSGHSSHGRAMRLGEDNRRDLFVVKFNS